MSRPAALLVNRRFWPLFWAQFLGAFNDNFLKNAVVILITYSGLTVWGIKSDAMSTFAPALLMVPYLLFSAIAGQLADHCPKAWLIQRVKLAEVFLMVIAAVGFLAGMPQLLLLTILLLGLQATFFGPIKYSILPQLLAEDELVAGNALVEMGTNLAILTGTIAGGVLIAMKGGGLVAVTAGLIICALAGWASTLFLLPTPAEAPELKVQWNPITTTWDICRSVLKTRPILLSILGVSWFWLYGSALLGLFLPYARDVLHANEHVVTLFLALFSVGVGVGSMLCEKMSFDRLELGLVPLGSIGMTLFAADLCLAWRPGQALPPGGMLDVAAFLAHPGGIRVVIDLVLLAVFSGFFIVPLYTFIQSRAEPTQRSRIIAVTNIVSSLFIVGWAVIQIGLLTVLSVTTIFLLVAFLNACVALYIYMLIPEFFLRFLAWMLTNVIYRVRVTGQENVPREGPAVLVSNHVSFVDWLVVYGAVKRPVRFVTDPGLMHPWMRALLRQAHVIPIAPESENPEGLSEAMDQIAAELEAGEIVCLFPEGELTRTGEMAPFKSGIERIVARSSVPVVPMALGGLWGSFFSMRNGRALRGNPLRRLWSRITLEIGVPVPAADVTAPYLFDRVAALRGQDGDAPC